MPVAVANCTVAPATTAPSLSCAVTVIVDTLELSDFTEARVRWVKPSFVTFDVGVGGAGGVSGVADFDPPPPQATRPARITVAIADFNQKNEWVADSFNKAALLNITLNKCYKLKITALGRSD